MNVAPAGFRWALVRPVTEDVMVGDQAAHATSADKLGWVGAGPSARGAGPNPRRPSRRYRRTISEV